MTSKHYTFTCLFSFTIITFVLNKQKNKSLFTIHGEFRMAILQTFQLLVNFLIVNYESTMTILNFQQLNICRRVQIKQLKFAFFSFPIHSWLLSMELNGEWAEEKHEWWMGGFAMCWVLWMKWAQDTLPDLGLRIHFMDMFKFIIMKWYF